MMHAAATRSVPSTRIRLRLLCLLVIALAWRVVPGCGGYQTTDDMGNVLSTDIDNSPHGSAIVLPQQALLGNQVAVSVDSNYIPFGEAFAIEKYNLTEDLVKIRLETGPTSSPTIHAEIPADFVFDAGPTHPQDDGVDVKPGIAITVALFTLPPAASGFDVPLNLPAENVRVRLFVDDGSGTEGDLLVWGKMDIVERPAGWNAKQVVFSDDSDPASMAPKPMIRLKGIADEATAFDFNSTDLIGGIEFTISYDGDYLQQPRAVPATEAVNATVLVGPETVPPMGDRTAKVVLIDPAGMREGWLTQGPFLDIVFDKQQAFDKDTVTISNLRIFDLDGNEPFGTIQQPNDFLRKIARDES